MLRTTEKKICLRQPVDSFSALCIVQRSLHLFLLLSRATRLSESEIWNEKGKLSINYIKRNKRGCSSTKNRQKTNKKQKSFSVRAKICTTTVTPRSHQRERRMEHATELWNCKESHVYSSTFVARRCRWRRTLAHHKHVRHSIKRTTPHSLASSIITHELYGAIWV